MNNISLNHFFISFSHKDKDDPGGIDDVNAIFDYFEEIGYNFIYDSEMSIGSEWDTRARRYISSSKCLGVAVLLSKRSLVSKPVLRELDLTRLNNKPVMPIVVGADSLDELYSKTVKFLTSEEDLFVVDEIMKFFNPETIFITDKQLFSEQHREKLEKTFASWGLTPIPKKSTIHSTYRSDYSNEKNRLLQQRKLFYETDKKAFSLAVNNSAKDTFYVLDIAGNDGGLVMQHVQDITDKKVVCIGVDIDMNAVMKANATYGNTGQYHSYCMDCVSEDFDSSMTAIMEQHNIPGFDFVVCSFALLHVDDPFHCLTNVRKLMRRGGYIFIRDIDDGLSISYPDPNNLVEKFENFSAKLSFTGKRDSGRSIPNMLTRASFKDIQVITEELNTLNKDADFLDVLFNVNFRFILVGLQQSYENDTNNKKAEENYKWGKQAFRELEDLFHEPGYYYRMGSMVFLARR